MPEQLQRLPRPTSALEVQEGSPVSPSRGINRSNLTLYFSIVAIILSVAGAGVQLFIFLAGHQQQMAAQAALDSAQRELVAVQIQTEKQHARAAAYDADLKAQEIKTSAAQEQDALSSRLDHLQDAAKKSFEKVSAAKRADVDTGVLTPALIKALADSAQFSSNGRKSYSRPNADAVGNLGVYVPGATPATTPIKMRSGVDN